MGPGGNFDPVWTLMAMFSIMEVIIVALLVMPMPSNKARGAIQGSISKLWRSQEYVKRIAWVLLALNSYYAYDSMSNLIEHNKIYAASIDAQFMSMYLQRNALLSGGSVFLFFVMRRLLDIQGQLFETRQLVKEAAAHQQQLLTDGSGPGSSEKQAALRKTLTHLERALSDVDVADQEVPVGGSKRD